MRNDLGVGLGCKNDTAFFQSAFQLRIVFNDPVMDYGDLFVPIDMRVGVYLAWNPVGCPAGMSYPDLAFQMVRRCFGV